ncbi:META domain-containing protein [Methylomicrobium sp. Wu6]|uniref:META domain-containing protein n=1 Tax=Methylomicrobium sp. Wu6 TaxID=3107928 RepID=UPI002DD639DD|nr:META domain-containing protein [Methylomicrobium sp. Wu6]MEC4748114.1 META domain-containing protein [Methylomicrobium sp. Wu6]
MKSYKFRVIAVLMANGLIAACSGTSGGKVADMPGQNAAQRALTENGLANACYRIDRLGAFSLDKGEFNRQYGEGIAQRDKVALEKIAFGDLDHDGLSDAAVILAWQSGGSGTFRYLMAMRNTGNASRQQDGILLGDRVQISALSIGDGEVRLEKVQAGPSDPACCPSQRIKQAYSLRDGKLAQSADKIGDLDASISLNSMITGIVWKWKHFKGTSESRHFVIGDPNKYTLILLPNGSYRAKADCNRMQGRYTLDGRRIKIGPGAATLAECEPGSRYAEYLKDLTEAVSFVVHDNQLVLNLVMDGESLVFENGGTASNNPRY